MIPSAESSAIERKMQEAENMHLIIMRILSEEDGLMTARRNLIAQTKDFKQLPLEEQQSNYQDLLKLYQKEIDSLVLKLRDYYLAFRQTIPILTSYDDMAQLLEQNEQLKRQVDDLEIIQQENTELSLGLEAANAMISRQLKQLDEFKLMNTENSNIQAELSQKSREINEMRGVLAEREANILSLNQLIKDKHMESENMSLRAGELARERDEAIQAKVESEKLKKDELEIITMNFHNTRQQVIALQRDNELLKMELQSKGESNPEAKSVMLERECSKLQEQISEIKKENKRILHEKALLQAELEKGNADKANANKLTAQSTAAARSRKTEEEMAGLKSKIQELSQRVTEADHGMFEKSEKIKELQETIRQYEESTTIKSMPLVNQALSPNQDTAVVTVLTHQRDRFKKQSQDLEKRLTEIENKLEKEMSASTKLRGENADLLSQLSIIHSTRRNGLNYDSEKGECDVLNCEIGLNPMVQKLKVFMQTGDTNILRHLGHILTTQKCSRRIIAVYFVFLHILLFYIIFRKH